MPLDETFVGEQAIFSAGNDEYPVTNIELTIETQTSQIQQETSFDPTTAISGMRYSGSFEYQGINNDWIDGLFEVNSADKFVQPKNSFISISEENLSTRQTPNSPIDTIAFDDARSIILRGVTITNVDRSIPADDVATTTLQFQADSLDIIESDIR